MRLMAVLLGLLFVITGIMHLVRPAFFTRQVPSWIPFDARRLVAATGVIEIVLGVFLVTGRGVRPAGVAAAALLIAFAPVHVDAVAEARTASRRRRELMRFPINGAYLLAALVVAVGG